MRNGYVIFDTQALFDSIHNQGKISLGFPRVGRVNGRLAPHNQQTVEITRARPHPSNNTVIAYVPEEWPENLKDGFTFRTQEEVSEYFPRSGI